MSELYSCIASAWVTGSKDLYEPFGGLIAFPKEGSTDSDQSMAEAHVDSATCIAEPESTYGTHNTARLAG